MFRTLPTLTAIAAIVITGVVQGVWTHRWSDSRECEAAAERLAQVPMTVDDWQGQDEAINPRELAVAQGSGMLRRQYTNTKNGARVAFLIICGRPGPISLHTPDVCYRGSGYELIGAEVQRDFPGDAGGQFWLSRFDKHAVETSRLSITYGWSATGQWEAPDKLKARIVFAHLPVLYKLYVVRELTQQDSKDGDPSVDFLNVMLPRLQTALFSAP